MFLKINEIFAQCDIPCKIYDPVLAQIGVLTVIRLTDLILELKSSPDSLKNRHQISRLIYEKESQGNIVKEEVRVIWGDYFKEKQIQLFPEVHDLVHLIMQDVSRCKQELSRTNGESLLEKVNHFANIYWSCKEVKTRLKIAPYPPGLPILMPELSNA